MKMLNLGCGQRYHQDWVNVDLVSKDKQVLAHDLSKSIPFPENYFDAVYHSHLLEHFSRREAGKFLKECYRVLKPGGILRVAVPDLEKIARAYLQVLPNALANDPKAKLDHEWLMLELWDQMAREKNGGEIVEYLKQGRVDNLDFVVSRVGQEAVNIRDYFEQQQKKGNMKGNLSKIKDFLKKLRERLRQISKFYDYYCIGKFRSSGEVHKWMYDSFSLAELLKHAGFTETKVCGPFESRILSWGHYELDGKDGQVFKPDSLFMEAVKQ